MNRDQLKDMMDSTGLTFGVNYFRQLKIKFYTDSIVQSLEAAQSRNDNGAIDGETGFSEIAYPNGD